MSVPKWILLSSFALFATIAVMALTKKGNKQPLVSAKSQKAELASETPVISVPAIPVSQAFESERVKPFEKVKKGKEKKKNAKTLPLSSIESPVLARPAPLLKDDFPNIDRIFQFFSFSSSKLPIVETVTYSSTVPWLKGKLAWIADYANYYNTSRHFIARSLNGKPDYFTQNAAEGSKFNVFRKDKKIHFYLLVDVSRCKMGFYYVDLETNERVLLKTYRVGLGRLDATKPSGTLTPLGRYSLGSRVAIYKPGTTGFYQDKEVEMIRVFGTRWLPFEQGVERATAPAKGYGLQGAPWKDANSNELMENRDVIGAYDSDGCIRLNSEDIEEIFAIVLTKPTFIEIVKDFHDAKLPGIEVATPSR